MREAAAIRHRLSVVSPLERRLREWGLAYGIRPATGDHEPDAETVLHRVSLDRSRESQAPGESHVSQSRSRARLERLRQSLGERVKVPDWARGDAIRCVETRTPGPGWSPPLETEQVEEQVLLLARWDARAALALRASYCLLGRRPVSERIEWMKGRGVEAVSRMGFRAAIARGRMALGAALKLDG